MSIPVKLVCALLLITTIAVWVGYTESANNLHQSIPVSGPGIDSVVIDFEYHSIILTVTTLSPMSCSAVINNLDINTLYLDGIAYVPACTSSTDAYVIIEYSAVPTT